MTRIPLALLPLLLFVTAAALDPYYTSDALTVQVTISGAFLAEGQGTLRSVEANVSLVPLSTASQEIRDTAFSPNPITRSPQLTYVWENPHPEDLAFQSEYRIRVQRNAPEIRERIPFPLPSIPREVQPYLAPQRIIDADDPSITALSKQLTAGQQDLASAVHAVATWVVTNIVYNLSTANVQAVEKASTVLRHRDGVCDELTSLFIALLRASGVPARFVSGIAYTNSALFENPWGPHGWAEVYFPGVGWVPYDITYEELGWVDATHIVTAYSTDATSLSVDYAWEGKGVTLTATPLEVTAEVLSSDPGEPIAALMLEPLQETVGFGSANRLIATATNLRDYLVTVPLRISRTNTLTVLSPETQFALLPPKAKRQVSWLVAVPHDLKVGYRYTYPVSVSAFGGYNSSTSFTAVERGRRFTTTELPTPPDIPIALDAPLALQCAVPKLRFNPEDRIQIDCTVRSTDRMAREISLCMGSDCQSLTTGDRERSARFAFHPAQPGDYQLTIIARADDAAASSSVFFTALDTPALVVSAITAPAVLTFRDTAQVEFRVRKQSFADGYNATVRFGDLEEFPVPLFDSDRQFTILLSGAELDPGENEILISVTWADQRGKAYQSEAALQIQLADVTLLQRIAFVFRDLERGISRLFR